MKYKLLMLVFALWLTACAGKITVVEYEYSVPVKAIEIYFMAAPRPMADVRPPTFQNTSGPCPACGRASFIRAPAGRRSQTPTRQANTRSKPYADGDFNIFIAECETTNC
jgi:hypothetical protein